MSELLTYLILYALFAATISFLFAMLFIHNTWRWWMRAATVVTGLGAALLPFYLASKTLGYPDPWPPEGRYQVLGWEIDEGARAFYIFVQADGDPVPRHYRLPFKLETALKLQQARRNIGTYKEISVVVADGPSRDAPSYAFTLEKVFSYD